MNKIFFTIGMLGLLTSVFYAIQNIHVAAVILAFLSVYLLDKGVRG